MQDPARRIRRFKSTATLPTELLGKLVSQWLRTCSEQVLSSAQEACYQFSHIITCWVILWCFLHYFPSRKEFLRKYLVKIFQQCTHTFFLSSPRHIEHVSTCYHVPCHVTNVQPGLTHLCVIFLLKILVFSNKLMF